MGHITWEDAVAQREGKVDIIVLLGLLSCP